MVAISNCCENNRNQTLTLPLKPPLSRFSSSNASPSEGAPLSGSYGCTPQSLPKFWHSSHELLRDNGFTQQGYHKYRRRCLNGTAGRSTAHCGPPQVVRLPFSTCFLFIYLFIFRAQTVGSGSVSGDEHPVPVLVLLPEGQLQQEDVRGVQAVFGWRRQRKQQVCVFVCLCVSFLNLALYPSTPVVRWAHSEVVNTLPERF